jgi:hypothetical protein
MKHRGGAASKSDANAIIKIKELIVHFTLLSALQKTVSSNCIKIPLAATT